MAAYIVADIEVLDSEAYGRYRTMSTAAVSQYGGEFLVRGGDHEVLEGDWTPRRLVVLRFEDGAAARRFWESPEYEEAKTVRRGAARGNFVLVEGA